MCASFVFPSFFFGSKIVIVIEKSNFLRKYSALVLILKAAATARRRQDIPGGELHLHPSLEGRRLSSKWVGLGGWWSGRGLRGRGSGGRVEGRGSDTSDGANEAAGSLAAN